MKAQEETKPYSKSADSIPSLRTQGVARKNGDSAMGCGRMVPGEQQGEGSDAVKGELRGVNGARMPSPSPTVTCNF